MTKDSKNESLIGDVDPAPILTTPQQTVQLTEEEYAERFGPPFGPCGVPCDCDDCEAYRDQLRSEGPSRPIDKEARYQATINKIIHNEPRAEWREAIKGAICFIREWRDEEGSFCDQLDCDLRDLCQATWESLEGGFTLPGEALTAPARVRTLGQRKKRGRPPGKAKKSSKPKWEGTGKYERVPYVGTGRPIDLIATDLYAYLGMPAHLPSEWFYGASKTQADLNAAKESFVTRFGAGLFAIHRSSYHQYLLDGEHLMRLWVNAAGGGWMDCSRSLTPSLLKAGTMDLTKTPVSGRSTKFRFYPYRTFLSRNSIEAFKTALTKHPQLAHSLEKIEQQD